MSDTTEKHVFQMTKREVPVKEVFDLMLDEGIDTPTAARYSLTALAKPRVKFVEWLSDGTLTRKNGKTIEKPAA